MSTPDIKRIVDACLKQKAEHGVDIVQGDWGVNFTNWVAGTVYPHCACPMACLLLTEQPSFDRVLNADAAAAALLGASTHEIDAFIEGFDESESDLNEYLLPDPWFLAGREVARQLGFPVGDEVDEDEVDDEDDDDGDDEPNDDTHPDEIDGALVTHGVDA